MLILNTVDNLVIQTYTDADDKGDSLIICVQIIHFLDYHRIFHTH
jgi:hypothetical protein